MKLSPAYQRAFTDMLGSIATWRARAGARVCAMWPEQGPSYQPHRSLLVIGRATNGFEGPFEAIEASTPEGCQAIVSKARSVAEEYSLSWLRNRSDSGGTTATRSAFWRVTAAVARALDPDLAHGGDWASSVAWSNLAKVAPHDRGNPTSRLLALQANACSDLIRLEIDELQPRVVLVIAGRSWCEQFSAGLPWSRSDDAPIGPVRQAVRKDGQLWIFCDRPERRSEADFANDVRRVFTDHLSDLR